jgi:hypothetical protein
MSDANESPLAGAGMPMSTTFELPGLRVRESLGVCYGLVVRSMGAIGGVAASFKALRRGEVPSTPACSRTAAATQSTGWWRTRDLSGQTRSSACGSTRPRSASN